MVLLGQRAHRFKNFTAASKRSVDACSRPRCLVWKRRRKGCATIPPSVPGTPVPRRVRAARSTHTELAPANRELTDLARENKTLQAKQSAHCGENMLYRVGRSSSRVMSEVLKPL